MLALVVSLVGFIAPVVALVVIFSSVVCSLLSVGLGVIIWSLFTILGPVIPSVIFVDVVWSGSLPVVFDDGFDGSGPSVVVFTMIVAIVVIVLVVSIVASGHGFWMYFIDFKYLYS